jgi:hypothetical protein
MINKFFDKQERKVSNKIKTAGYFIKRLKDSGFVVFKIFNAYGASDPRRWTVLVDPGVASVYITCYTNKNELGEVLFEIDDGGQKIPNKLYFKTESIETLVTYLIENGVNNDPAKSPFAKLNNEYGRRNQQ